MANLKNWQPDMTQDEQAWFDACPKAVLFWLAAECCRPVRDSSRPYAAIADDAEAAFARMREEWAALHANGIVPQKPFDVEKAAAKLAAYRAQVAARQAST